MFLTHKMNLFRITSIKLIGSLQIRLSSCWSCGNDTHSLISNLFCSRCKALQKPNSNDNYFKIIGISETFDLDENDLAKKYKDLQKYLHPDKFANR